MKYVLEDKNKISFFICWLQCCLSNKQYITLLISKEKGWLGI